MSSGVNASNNSGSVENVTNAFKRMTLGDFEAIAIAVGGHTASSRQRIKDAFKAMNGTADAIQFMSSHLLKAQVRQLHTNGVLHQQVIMVLAKNTKSHSPPTWLANAFRSAFENGVQVVIDFANNDADMYQIVADGRAAAHSKSDHSMRKRSTSPNLSHSSRSRKLE